MLEELAALASAGGAALVGAMATDAWQTARSGIAALLGRGTPVRQSAIEAQLDGNADLVARAEDPVQVRETLVPLWQLELQELLRRNPEAADELRAVVARVQAALPAAQRSWVQTWEQINISRDHSAQYNVQHGTLNVHPDRPRPGGDLPGASGARSQ
ncbi:MAG: hypothetical protein ACRDTH_22045 [Pseudonocardiaceae bacterium]